MKIADDTFVATTRFDIDVLRMTRAVAEDTRNVLVLVQAYFEALEDRFADDAFRDELCDFIGQASRRVDRSLEKLEQIAETGPPAGVAPAIEAATIPAAP